MPRPQSAEPASGAASVSCACVGVTFQLWPEQGPETIDALGAAATSSTNPVGMSIVPCVAGDEFAWFATKIV